LRYTLVREGEVVVIRKRTEGKEYFLLADIDYNEEEKTKNIKRNLGGEIVELKVKYHNRKGLIGNLSNKSEIEKNDFDITDVIIFYNNSQGEGELKRGQHQIKKIVKIEEQFLKDLETSRPRILAYHPLINTKSKAEMLKKYIFEEANDLITIASLNEGDKPSLHN
jgi:hypothetical protein